MGIQTTQHDIRVGYCRLRSTAHVGCRTWYCPRTLGANLERAACIDIGDAATACSDGFYINHRNAHSIALYCLLRGVVGLSISQQANIGARAPHVKRNNLRFPAEPGNVLCRHHARTRSGKSGAHRHIARFIYRYDAAVRLRDVWPNLYSHFPPLYCENYQYTAPLPGPRKAFTHSGCSYAATSRNSGETLCETETYACGKRSWIIASIFFSCSGIDE